MYNWITLLYTWNQHNIANQLYSNIKFKNLQQQNWELFQKQKQANKKKST